MDGILNDEEKEILLRATLKNGGEISYKDNGDGTKSPYELNINYQDALASPDEDDSLRIGRFLAAETILLSLQGLPGIYIHSLLGSRNDYYGKTTSGIFRRINREKLDLDYICGELIKDSNRRLIFDELIRRLNIRKEHSAFSPASSQKILNKDSRLLAFSRHSKDGETVLVLINVSSERVVTDCDFAGLDLLSGKEMSGSITLDGLQCVWLLKEDD